MYVKSFEGRNFHSFHRFSLTANVFPFHGTLPSAKTWYVAMYVSNVCVFDNEILIMINQQFCEFEQLVQTGIAVACIMCI